MKNKLLTSALGLVGLLTLGSTALAQTTTFDIGPDLQNGGKAGQGDWHVSIVETAPDAFTIHVTASSTLTPKAAGETVYVLSLIHI